MYFAENLLRIAICYACAKTNPVAFDLDKSQVPDFVQRDHCRQDAVLFRHPKTNVSAAGQKGRLGVRGVDRREVIAGSGCVEPLAAKRHGQRFGRPDGIQGSVEGRYLIGLRVIGQSRGFPPGRPSMAGQSHRRADGR